ncbi:MAG: cytochrome c oxidase assembly protein [Chloroflexi bacterium]|nr:cytochrome c oxidase assembly protein [Chloroflexota bacterium]
MGLVCIPTLYNAALRHGWVHDLEHITFFLTAMLFWWRVTGAGPKVHQNFLLGRVGSTHGVPANMIFGRFSLPPSPIYSFYGTVFLNYRVVGIRRSSPEWHYHVDSGEYDVHYCRPDFTF